MHVTVYLYILLYINVCTCVPMHKCVYVYIHLCINVYVQDGAKVCFTVVCETEFILVLLFINYFIFSI